jgi:hypothetical protein
MNLELGFMINSSCRFSVCVLGKEFNDARTLSRLPFAEEDLEELQCHGFGEFSLD